ncbi:MAG TPA: hypothetical protein PLS67_12105 [Accumulibacter sp.]|nr:hypothetical protein [Accumulibacter sp.]HQC81238.1 hypothetical protein [Accumulibacter sp.]
MSDKSQMSTLTGKMRKMSREDAPYSTEQTIQQATTRMEETFQKGMRLEHRGQSDAVAEKQPDDKFTHRIRVKIRPRTK